MAMSHPGMHNLYEAYRHMYEALGVKDIDRLLPPPPQPQPLDPASENILALNGKKNTSVSKTRPSSAYESAFTVYGHDNGAK